MSGSQYVHSINSFAVDVLGISEYKKKEIQKRRMSKSIARETKERQREKKEGENK